MHLALETSKTSFTGPSRGARSNGEQTACKLLKTAPRSSARRIHVRTTLSRYALALIKSRVLPVAVPDTGGYFPLS